MNKRCRFSYAAKKMPTIQEILKPGYARAAFEKLKGAGVDGERLATMLRLIPTFSDEAVPLIPWTDVRRIDGLVKRLIDIADDVESMNKSQFVLPAAIESSLWAAIRRAAFAAYPLDWRGAIREEAQLPRSLRELPQLLHLYAEVLTRLREWHQLAYPRGFSLRASALRDLIELVKASTKGRIHWNDLAILLNAAFDAAGASSEFTRNWLQVFDKRHHWAGMRKSVDQRA
jgi:hypothetical protein